VPCSRYANPHNHNAAEIEALVADTSGTTIIAAETTGRPCHAIELDPIYVDVAVLRWQNFTGTEAVLQGDGRPFGVVRTERKAAG
jgi:hypothetical protein